MTPKRAPAAEPPKRPSAAKQAAKTPAKKGSTPAKKAPKRAAAGTKRARTGAKETPGGRMRRELARAGDTVGIEVLIRQAARVADRLENIDRVLSGDGATWTTVGIPRSDEKRGRIVVEVRVDNLMVEERSQTTLLRHLLAEIHRQRSGLPGGPPPPDEDDDLDVD